MTGYGKASVTYNNKKISVEIKSLNSKALDLSTRIAPLYREHEMDIRAMIAKCVIRGKVDFAIWIEKENGGDATTINSALVENYYNQIKELSDKIGVDVPKDWFNILLKLPDVTTKTEVEELDEEEWIEVKKLINLAIDRFTSFRKQEGEALYKKFSEKISNISALLKQIEPYEQSRVEKIKQRLLDNLNALPEVEYDKNRFEQELIYYIEKLDINEEKQRLANHLKYFTTTMNEGHGQGKKLGFIAQEMGREINTTGSKSNQAEMQNIVVKMKDELEQIKEQVLNVL